MARVDRGATGVLAELTRKLQELPQDRLEEVLDFVEFLRSRSGRGPKLEPGSMA